jgi:TonB-dependent starch-binding outer membrane protein SusC
MSKIYVIEGRLKPAFSLVKRAVQLGLSVALLLMAIGVSAQGRTVSGRVTDSKGEGVPGVNVVEKGTGNGVVTDLDGRYSISVGENAILVFSYVGLATQEVSVGSQTSLDVKMADDFQQLSEIVVIGYGAVEKKDLTGSVVSIGAKDFNQGNFASPQDLLVGRVAGVSVVTDGGGPGTGASILIRGQGSLSASTSPLFVIDGIPVSNEGISGMRNPLAAINPNDIESITVLKDASATAIYGARAAGGVIIVTTKRGTSGKMQLSYDAQYSVSTLPKRVQVPTAAEYEFLVVKGIEDGKISAPAYDLLGDGDTDWQDEIYRTGLMANHNISASGTFQQLNLPYRFSLGYMDQEGILKNTNYQRTSMGINLDPSFLNGDLKISINAKGSYNKNQFTNEGAIGSAVTFDPTQSPRQSDSPWGGYFYWGQTSDPLLPITIAPANPVALIEQTNNQSGVYRLLGNTKIDYKIPVIEGLTATLNLGIDRSWTNGFVRVSPEAAFTRREQDVDEISTVLTGENNTYSALIGSQLLEAYGTYTRELSNLDSKIDVVAGYSWQKFHRTSGYRNFDGLRTVSLGADTARSENYLLSLFGRLNYTYKERYILTVSVRRDASSRFRTAEGGNFWGTFPSVAAAWRVKDERFMQSVGFISDLKVRGGWGITAQEDLGGNYYPGLARMTLSNEFALIPFGQEMVRLARFEAYDATIKWEETTTVNAGIDFGIWGNRIYGSIDWYKRTTTDLLNTVPVPVGTNFSNEVTTNVGTMVNTGIELMLNAVVVNQGDLRVDVGYNISHNQNEITRLTLVADPNYVGVYTGGIAGGVGTTGQIHSVGFPARSFFLYQQVYDPSGKPIEGLFVDQNGDGIINDFDRVRYKHPAAAVLMGFSTNVSYRDYFFGFNGRLSLGNYVYNNVSSNYGFYNNIYNSQGYLANVTSDINRADFIDPRYLSDYYLENGSFFRMDNITFGYRFSEFFSSRANAILNFTVQNAFVITKYRGLDPEISSGIDNNIYPRPRVFTLGLNVTFR